MKGNVKRERFKLQVSGLRRWGREMAVYFIHRLLMEHFTAIYDKERSDQRIGSG
jgi:hypothetical protein